ncbi:MBL fold metallo-hydrolase [Zhihengliuella alba]|uniref:MBL fold metallo-hydrolase n=1 Tax=Zhihengliuella alba TaxID=547018 RepID=A0ABP7CT15_9MICC
MDSPSAPAHDLEHATVLTLSVSEMDNNVYLVTSKATGAQLLIDAAADAPAIEGLVRSGAGDAAAPARVEVIATTHQHWDHVRALASLARSTGAELAAGTDDAAAIEESESVTVGHRLAHGDTLSVGDLELSCVHLRGHTPGSIALVLRDRPAGSPEDAEAATLVFSGDSLFPGGVGNTGGDASRFAQLYDDVSSRLFDAYDDAVVLPGHGAPTTLAAERPSLPEWRARGW